MPKVDLHCHVEGTMRPQTLVVLAQANGVPLPSTDPTELYRYTSLDGFLEIFWLVQSTLSSRTDWARLGYEAVVDSAAHGVVHLEPSSPPPDTSLRVVQPARIDTVERDGHYLLPVVAEAELAPDPRAGD